MNLNENHSRAQQIFDSWPEWKKEVSLTKYSTKPTVKASVTGDDSLNGVISDPKKNELKEKSSTD